MAKDIAPYFRHDCNARRDERILALRCMHGWKGYGVFWAIIELLSETPAYELPADYGLLSVEVNAPSKLIKSIIEDFDIFTITEKEGKKRFHANRLSRDMEVKDKASQTARDKVDKRWSKSKNNEDGNTENELSNTEIEISNTEIEISNTEIEISNTEIEISNTEIEISNTNKSKSKNNNKSISSLRSETLSCIEGENEKATSEISQTKLTELSDEPPIRADGKPKIGLAWVIPLWAKLCPHLAQPTKLSPDRVRALNARAHEAKAKTAEHFQQVLTEHFTRVAQSDFLSGRSSDFRANFDWVLQAKNWQKISEGNYDTPPNTPSRYASPSIHHPAVAATSSSELYHQQRDAEIQQQVLRDLAKQQ